MSISRAVPAAPATSERRAKPRQNVIDNEVISVDIGPGDTGGIVLDLSEDGMAVQALAPVEPRTSKVLQWSLPGNRERLKTACTVAWSNETNWVGFQFRGLKDHTRSLIREWLQQLAVNQPKSDEAAFESLSTAMGTAASQAVTQLITPSAGAVASSGAAKAQFSTANALLRVAQGISAPADAAPQTAPEPAPEHGLSLYAELSQFAEQACTWTGAEGAAIALLTAGEVVCRGTSGVAPDLGTRLETREGLSAECMNTGRVVTCDDATYDSRVDAAVCHALGLRSALIVPVISRGTAIGFVECLSARPHAFTQDSVIKLQGIADAVLALLSPSAVETPDTAFQSFRLAEPAHDEPSAMSSRMRVMLVTLAFVILLLAALLALDWLTTPSRSPGPSQPAQVDSAPATKLPASTTEPQPSGAATHQHGRSKRRR